jgi:hypothetical protein
LSTTSCSLGYTTRKAMCWNGASQMCLSLLIGSFQLRRWRLSRYPSALQAQCKDHAGWRNLTSIGIPEGVEQATAGSHTICASRVGSHASWSHPLRPIQSSCTSPSSSPHSKARQALKKCQMTRSAVKQSCAFSQPTAPFRPSPRMRSRHPHTWSGRV